MLALALLVGAAGRVAAAAPDACALLNDHDIKALLKQPAEPHRVGWAAYAAICGWRGKSANLSVLLETDEILRDYKAANPSAPVKKSAAEQFDSASAQQKELGPVPVKGIGERAFWSTTAKQLWVFKNNKTLVVAINRKKDSGTADDLEGAKAAARLIAPKL